VKAFMDAAESRQLKKVTLPISGMSCAACANRMEKGLNKRKGWFPQTVDFAVKKSTVSYDSSVTKVGNLVQNLSLPARPRRSVLCPWSASPCA